jgi:hypothetical protein
MTPFCLAVPNAICGDSQGPARPKLESPVHSPVKNALTNWSVKSFWAADPNEDLPDDGGTCTQGFDDSWRLLLPPLSQFIRTYMLGHVDLLSFCPRCRAYGVLQHDLCGQ